MLLLARRLVIVALAQYLLELLNVSEQISERCVGLMAKFNARPDLQIILTDLNHGMHFLGLNIVVVAVLSLLRKLILNHPHQASPARALRLRRRPHSLGSRIDLWLALAARSDVVKDVCKTQLAIRVAPVPALVVCLRIKNLVRRSPRRWPSLARLVHRTVIHDGLYEMILQILIRKQSILVSLDGGNGILV